MRSIPTGRGGEAAAKPKPLLKAFPVFPQQILETCMELMLSVNEDLKGAMQQVDDLLLVTTDGSADREHTVVDNSGCGVCSIQSTADKIVNCMFWCWRRRRNGIFICYFLNIRYE